MIAEVAFNLPLEKTFHYLVPEPLQSAARPGMRVAAPFGPRERTGFIVRFVDRSPFSQLKPVRRLIDAAPVITDERWALAEWMSAYYYCSVGEALSAMVPSGLRLPKTGAEPDGAGGPTTQALALTPHQAGGLRAILEAVSQARAARRLATPAGPQVLVHGVTGSGKTELYLQAIAKVLAEGQSAICLVPEIAITPQMVERFTGRFGALVAVWHSRMRASERSRAWAAMASGGKRVVIGARSAVFSPVRSLGLIVIDEEHETSYKQAEAPRYHAREVAVVRAGLANAVVVLGSATPSVESYYAATRPGGRLVHLPERIMGRPLPQVEVVDLREEIANRRGQGPFSARLSRALEATVRQGGQAMLLLNRRGFARTAQCQTCGTVERCPQCSVPLIYHASRRVLLCHYCNTELPAPEICAHCKKGYVRYRGSGTERVESELHRLFPATSIARMDRDTMSDRESHQRIYDAVKGQEVNLLVGTQMIAKGFDFPLVTLVGVISADTALNLPDFRAGERTFDLLAQMAGRAGRGDLPGRVVVQTYCPDHYAIQAAKTHDYKEFYRAELAARRSLSLPPFVHLVELTIMGRHTEKVQVAAAELAGKLRAKDGKSRVSLLGPAPHRIPRLRKVYRMCLMLKAARPGPIVELVRSVLQPGRKFNGLPVLVDVDPL